jgi:hypothetical protein
MLLIAANFLFPRAARRAVARAEGSRSPASSSSILSLTSSSDSNGIGIQRSWGPHGTGWVSNQRVDGATASAAIHPPRCSLEYQAFTFGGRMKYIGPANARGGCEC